MTTRRGPSYSGVVVFGLGLRFSLNVGLGFG